MHWIHLVKMKQLLDTVNLNTLPTFVSSSSAPLVGSPRGSSLISQGSSSSDKGVKQVRLLSWGAPFVSSELCCGTTKTVGCHTEFRISYSIQTSCKIPMLLQNKAKRHVWQLPHHPQTHTYTQSLHMPNAKPWTCLILNLPLYGLMLPVYSLTISCSINCES